MYNEECCPRFNPKPWHNRIFRWNDRKFVRGSVLTIFYMPVNFGGVITSLNKKVEKAGAKIPQWLCLSDHTSPWNMDIYLAVDRKIADANNVTMSGKFLSRVYEGPYKDTGKWCNDFEEYAKKRNLNIGKWYMWYTTCPKCAKKYGKNYVVIIAEVINMKRKKSKSDEEPTWDQIGKAIGMKLEKCKDEECVPWKIRMKAGAKSQGCGSALYGLGFIGALIYYITTATSITAGIIGIFKAIVWPAFLVYSMMKYLGM